LLSRGRGEVLTPNAATESGASAAEMTPAKAADVSATERHASLDERKTEQIKAIQANSFPIVRLRCRSALRAM